MAIGIYRREARMIVKHHFLCALALVNIRNDGNRYAAQKPLSSEKSLFPFSRIMKLRLCIQSKSHFYLTARTLPIAGRVRALVFAQSYNSFFFFQMRKAVTNAPSTTVNTEQITTIAVTIALFVSCISERMAVSSFSAVTSLPFNVSMAD